MSMRKNKFVIISLIVALGLTACGNSSADYTEGRAKELAEMHKGSVTTQEVAGADKESVKVEEESEVEAETEIMEDTQQEEASSSKKKSSGSKGSSSNNSSSGSGWGGFFREALQAVHEVKENEPIDVTVDKKKVQEDAKKNLTSSETQEKIEQAKDTAGAVKEELDAATDAAKEDIKQDAQAAIDKIKDSIVVDEPESTETTESTEKTESTEQQESNP